MCVYPGRGGIREITAKNISKKGGGQVSTSKLPTVINTNPQDFKRGLVVGGYLTHCHGGDQERNKQRKLADTIF